MNCDNCGAPMTVVDGRGYLRCDFCHTFSFPSELEDSIDRIESIGEKCDAECPCCNVQLENGLIEGSEILYCGRCRGILLTNDLFAEVIRRRRTEWTGLDARPQPLNQDDLKRRVVCPGCEKPMDAHPYYGPGNVVIDSCCRCHLVWVDHGEIAAIEQAPGVR